MMKRIVAASVGLAFLTVSGCATLLKGSNEQVMVSSEPSGANVSINGSESGTTPFVTTVPSSQNLQIQVSKAGYAPTTINDNTSFRWGYEIWSFVEFVIPLFVDMADGSAWGHDQTMIAVHLQPTPQSVTTATPTPAASPTPAAAPSPSAK